MSKIKLTPAEHKKIEKHVSGLNRILEDLQKKYPDFEMNWYLEDAGNFNLMSSESHAGNGSCNPRYENIVDCYTLNNASGGGW